MAIAVFENMDVPSGPRSCPAVPSLSRLVGAGNAGLRILSQDIFGLLIQGSSRRQSKSGLVGFCLIKNRGMFF
jgi:hypothetical protein